MNNLEKITAVIVLYSTTDIIFKCLENLRNIRVIVVDNGSNNENVINLLKKIMHLKSILNQRKILALEEQIISL
jgi:GT2 family glycosyltransferase